MKNLILVSFLLPFALCSSNHQPEAHFHIQSPINGCFDQIKHYLEYNSSPDRFQPDFLNLLGLSKNCICPDHMIQAVESGNPAVLKALVEAGGKLNFTFGRENDLSLLTCLLMRTRGILNEGTREMLEIILDSGVNATGNDLAYLFANQVNDQCRELALELLARCKPADLLESMLSIIVFEGGTREVLRAVIAAGGDPNGLFAGSKPLLIVAIQKASYELVQELLECGADPNVSYAGLSATMWASKVSQAMWLLVSTTK